MRQTAIIILISIFLASFCLADTSWTQDGNVGNIVNTVISGSSYTAFGSNIANNQHTTGYNKCLTSGSLFTPVAGDLDLDAVPEILISTASEISIIDGDCNLKGSISSVPVAMPILVNYTNDKVFDVVVVTSTNVEFWRYNTLSFSYEKYLNITYTGTSFTSGNVIRYFACDDKTSSANLTCFGQANALNGIVLNVTSSTNWTMYHNTAINITSSLNTNRLGMSISSRTTNGDQLGDRALTSCSIPGVGGSHYTKCAAWQQDGKGSLLWAISNGGIGGATDASMITGSSFYARQSTLPRFFASIRWNTAGVSLPIYWKLISSTPGVVSISTLDYIPRSNWVVADYNKDGINEACILENITTSNPYLACYDAFLTLTNISMPSMNYSSSIVMADFNKSAPTLGIGTVEGIFYADHAMNTTGFPAGVYSGNNGTVMTIQQSINTTSPMLIYTDYTLGFVYRDKGTSITCGNGVCDYTENEFNCASDCASNISGNCNISYCCSNSDCSSTLYPICVNHVCTRLNNYNGTLIQCLASSQCPVQNPNCVNGYCINAMLNTSSTNTSTLTPTTTNDLSMASALTDFWLAMAFQSEVIKFFYAMAFLFTGLFEIYKNTSKPGISNTYIVIIGFYLLCLVELALQLLAFPIFVLLCIVPIAGYIIDRYFNRTATGGG